MKEMELKYCVVCKGKADMFIRDLNTKEKFYVCNSCFFKQFIKGIDQIKRG